MKNYKLNFEINYNIKIAIFVFTKLKYANKITN